MAATKQGKPRKAELEKLCSKEIKEHTVSVLCYEQLEETNENEKFPGLGYVPTNFKGGKIRCFKIILETNYHGLGNSSLH